MWKLAAWANLLEDALEGEVLGQGSALIVGDVLAGPTATCIHTHALGSDHKSSWLCGARTVVVDAELVALPSPVLRAAVQRHELWYQRSPILV